MSAKKKLSNGSLPTQTENSRRFVRRNSIHTLNCRSGSLKKFTYNSEELFASSPHLQPATPTLNPEKNTPLHIETEDLFKEFEKTYEIPLKRSAGSMKIDHVCRDKKCHPDKINALNKELEAARQETEMLTAQCQKLKSHLHEERDKRRTLEEEARCSQLEIKRLEKRLDKYRNEKDRYEKERDTIIRHIEELQTIKFDADVKVVQGYRVKIMEEEVARLREELQKSRSIREKELLVEVERLIELKYGLQNELKSANIANIVLAKQLEQTEQQMGVIRESVHRAVTSSYEYIQLRERYRKMLLEYKELRMEMSMMEKDNSSASNVLDLEEGTLLTISETDRSIEI